MTEFLCPKCGYLIVGTTQDKHVCKPPTQKWNPDNRWDEHRLYTAEMWRCEVASNSTRLGYIDWVNNQIELRSHFR